MSDNSDVSVSDMLDNMADPEERQARKVDCPIDGCSYTGEPESVSGHVSASSQDDHIWSNTRFDGWKHFNREMQEQVEQQVDDVSNSNSSTGSSVSQDSRESPTMGETGASESVFDGSLELPCPIEGCTFTGDTVGVADHIEDAPDVSHTWSETQFDDRNAFFKFVEKMG